MLTAAAIIRRHTNILVLPTSHPSTPPTHTAWDGKFRLDRLQHYQRITRIHVAHVADAENLAFPFRAPAVLPAGDMTPVLVAHRRTEFRIVNPLRVIRPADRIAR